jgi:hypothetical protein
MSVKHPRAWVRHLVSSPSLLTMLLASLLLGASAHADIPPPKTVSEPIETVSRELHPAGPTIRKEWRHTAAASPYRIEFEGARSGQLLWEQTRLQRLPDGQWVVAFNRPASPPRAPVPLDARHPTRLKVGNARWTIEILKESPIAPQAGIATEAEPSIDLRLTREPR